MTEQPSICVGCRWADWHGSRGRVGRCRNVPTIQIARAYDVSESAGRIYRDRAAGGYMSCPVRAPQEPQP